MDKNSNSQPQLNRAQRRLLRRNKKRMSNRRAVRSGAAPANKVEYSDKIVYTDDSYKDKAKRIFTSGLKAAKERIQEAKKKIKLPLSINTVRRDLRTTAILINVDGHSRKFLPDYKGRHRLLVHGNIARHLVSSVCMFVRITANKDADGHTIDGSWAMVPAQYDMINATTIQHLRRRPLFFFHRYWYEISFDGRVQPAHLLYDYGLDPELRSQRLYVTREYVPVRKTDDANDYFRLWLHPQP